MQCEQQLMIVGAVVYNSYGARLFTVQTCHASVNTPEENRTY